MVTARAAGGMAVRLIPFPYGVEQDRAGIPLQLTADYDLVRAVEVHQGAKSRPDLVTGILYDAYTVGIPCFGPVDEVQDVGEFGQPGAGLSEQRLPAGVKLKTPRDCRRGKSWGR